MSPQQSRHPKPASRHPKPPNADGQTPAGQGAAPRRLHGGALVANELTKDYGDRPALAGARGEPSRRGRRPRGCVHAREGDVLRSDRLAPAVDEARERIERKRG